jgi:hypothetical protein
LVIKDGLPRLDVCPHTEDEYDILLHVLLTSELEWDPAVLDNEDSKFNENDNVLN